MPTESLLPVRAPLASHCRQPFFLDLLKPCIPTPEPGPPINMRRTRRPNHSLPSPSRYPAIWSIRERTGGRLDQDGLAHPHVDWATKGSRVPLGESKISRTRLTIARFGSQSVASRRRILRMAPWL
jgi:hypothetical protein